VVTLSGAGHLGVLTNHSAGIIAQAPGFGDFTITIGDHDIMGDPINNMPRD